MINNNFNKFSNDINFSQFQIQKLDFNKNIQIIIMSFYLKIKVMKIMNFILLIII